MTRIQDGDYQFSDEVWGGISPEAKDLIGRLLEKDVKQRLSAQQVLKHPWVTEELPETPLQTPGALKRCCYYMDYVDLLATSIIILFCSINCVY